MEIDPPKLSFSFIKSHPQVKMAKSTLLDKETNKIAVEKEFINAFEHSAVPIVPKQEAEEIVIPLKLSRSNLHVQLDKKYTQVDANDSLTLKAVQALSSAPLEHSDESKTIISNLILPMIDNQTDKSDDTETVDADYNAVPIEQFGMALLKGMGFTKESTGPLMEDYADKIRLKGLGLGADPKVLMKARQSKRDAHNGSSHEKLSWKVGSKCQIVWGKYDGQYGVIEGVDGDTARVVIRLALIKPVQNVMQAAVRLVSNAEFDKFSNYINQTSVKKYKESEKLKKSSNAISEEEILRKRMRLTEDSVENNTDSSKNTSSWLRKGLITRFLDKHYHHGKYYNQKVEIVSLSSSRPNTCCCQTKNGRIIKDVPMKDLETVIPKHKNSPVLILKGKYINESGRFIDKSKAMVDVYLRSLGKTVSVHFEDVCALST